MADLPQLLPAACLLALGHLTSTLAPAFGSVAFSNIVKTAEPLFTCAIAVVLYKRVFPWTVYASLFMVVCGVALVSVREINFSPFSLGFGMVSNCAFALYSIVAKLLLNTRDAESTYACLAALSCLVLSPVALVMEWSGAGASKVAAANSAIDQASTGHTGWHLVLLLLGTGIMQYVSNLIAFDTLSMIHPISYAMANTFKRSVVVGASLVFFKQRLPPAGALGAALALVGALGYSLAIDRDLRARAKLQERLMAVKARHGDKSLPPELAERLQIQHPRLVATPAAAVAISGKQSAAGSA